MLRLVLKVLEDDARPAKLRSCNPWGETKFSLQMRKGGLVSQGENSLYPSVVNYLWLIHSGACLWQCTCWRAQLQSHPHLWGNHRRRCHKVRPTFLYFSNSWVSPNKILPITQPLLNSPKHISMQRGRYLRWVHAPSCVGQLYASVPVEAQDTQMGNIDQTFPHAPILSALHNETN